MKKRRVLIFLAVILALAITGGLVFAENTGEEGNGVKRGQGLFGKSMRSHEMFNKGNAEMTPEQKEMRNELKALRETHKEEMKAMKEKLGDEFSRDNEEVKALMESHKEAAKAIFEKYGVDPEEMKGKGRKGGKGFMPGPDKGGKRPMRGGMGKGSKDSCDECGTDL
jgi:hypothetical protein